MKMRWGSSTLLLLLLTVSTETRSQADDDAVLYTAFEHEVEQLLREDRPADEILQQFDQLQMKHHPLSQPESAFISFMRCRQHVRESSSEGPSGEQHSSAPDTLADSTDSSAADYLCKGISSQSEQVRFTNQYQSYSLESSVRSAALRYWIAFYYAELGLRMGLEADGVRATGVMLRIADANASDYLTQRAYQMRAILQAELREFDNALVSNQLALDLATAPDERQGLLLNRGYILSYAERFDEAAALYQQLIDGEAQGIEVSDENKIHIGTNLSFIYAETGQTDKNLQLTETMVTLAQQLASDELSAWANMSRAFALFENGDIAQGRALFEQYSRWFLDNNYAVRTAEDYEQVSEILVAQGLYEEAYRYLKNSVDLFREVEAGGGDLQGQLVSSILAAEQSQRQLMQTQQSMALLQQRRQAQINLLLVILGGLTMVLAVGLYYYRRLTKLNHELDQTNARLDYESTHDPLTGAYNRRYFYQRLAEHNQTGTVSNNVLLALVDVDHFKILNDNYGHDVGDEVLKVVVKRLSNTLKAEDKLVRWGGEEFLLYLPIPDNKAHARSLVDRLLAEINSKPFSVNGINLSVTISMGYCIIKANNNIDEQVKRVDQLLYQAKTTGRSRAVGDI